MPIVGGLDIHRKQITFDYLDTVTGEVRRGQIAPADREHLRAWLARFAGRRVADTNRKQATAPRGFGLLPNPNGTAPGFQGEVSGALVVAMPGPPSELRPMFSTSVVPLM